MLAGAFVNVRMAPWVIGYFSLHIGSLPTGRVAWLLDEIIQAVFALRVIAVVDFEGIQRGAEGGDLRLCRRQARLFGASGKLRNDNRGENTENDKDQEQFDQCETAPPRVVRVLTESHII